MAMVVSSTIPWPIATTVARPIVASSITTTVSIFPTMFVSVSPLLILESRPSCRFHILSLRLISLSKLSSICHILKDEQEGGQDKTEKNYRLDSHFYASF
uniref:Uncharacterized protein n=1 Tax=Arundo donax TaxID=35708 RepID=A0A0A8ZZ14_ARUDO